MYNDSDRDSYYTDDDNYDYAYEDTKYFIYCCRKGMIDNLKLINKEEIEEMISANNFKAFRWASSNGHLDVIKYLVSLAQIYDETIKYNENSEHI